jgi:hypothetical protein
MVEIGMFPVATVELIERRSLQERMESKFILPFSRVSELLEGLGEHYARICQGSKTFGAYKNLYYDTEDYLCLSDHKRGRRPRFKVRFRHHVDRGLSFLEVKRRCLNDSTVKSRWPMPYGFETMSKTCVARVREASSLPAERFLTSLRVDFDRMTLVGIRFDERITLDSSIAFSSEAGFYQWPELVILEVKQAQLAQRTPIMQALRAADTAPLAISKYCLGARLVLPQADTDWYDEEVRFLESELASLKGAHCHD